MALGRAPAITTTTKTERQLAGAGCAGGDPLLRVSAPLDEQPRRRLVHGVEDLHLRSRSKPTPPYLLQVSTCESTLSCHHELSCRKALSPRERCGYAASLACCRGAIRPGSWVASTASTVSSSGGRAGTQASAEAKAPSRSYRGTRQLRRRWTRGGARGAFRSASGGE